MFLWFLHFCCSCLYSSHIHWILGRLGVLCMLWKRTWGWLCRLYFWTARNRANVYVIGSSCAWNNHNIIQIIFIILLCSNNVVVRAIQHRVFVLHQNFSKIWSKKHHNLTGEGRVNDFPCLSRQFVFNF